MVHFQPLRPIESRKKQGKALGFGPDVHKADTFVVDGQQTAYFGKQGHRLALTRFFHDQSIVEAGVVIGLAGRQMGSVAIDQYGPQVPPSGQQRVIALLLAVDGDLIPHADVGQLCLAFSVDIAKVVITEIEGRQRFLR